jgi:nucleotide-binding universal stress UspA family protein
MKIKPKKKSGGVVVELARKEERIPSAESNALPAFKIKHILVPVDFSECSKKALQYAVPFAEQFNAGIILLHVVQSFVPVPEMPAADFGALEAQICELAKLELATLKTNIPRKVETQTLLKIGNPYAEIIDAAEDLNADLIILSTHGRTGLKHFFLGSVTERVVRHAPCPVVVVREREHEFIETNQIKRE